MSHNIISQVIRLDIFSALPYLNNQKMELKKENEKFQTKQESTQPRSCLNHTHRSHRSSQHSRSSMDGSTNNRIHGNRRTQNNQHDLQYQHRRDNSRRKQHWN